MKALFLVLPLLAAPLRAETTARAEPLILSLDSAIELAIKQNLDVELARLRLETLQSYYRQAVAAAIPDVNLSASYTRNFVKPSFFLLGQKVQAGGLNSMRHAGTLEQVIYSGGVVSSGIKATRTGIAAGQEDVRSSRADVTLAVRNFFYAVFLASETAGIQADTLASAEDHLRTPTRGRP